MDVLGRYGVMHKSTFWRFRRVEQVNMYLHLVQREKQLIPTRKRLLKVVSMFCLCVKALRGWEEFVDWMTDSGLTFICLCISNSCCCITSDWAISIFIYFAWTWISLSARYNIRSWKSNYQWIFIYLEL
jgi:hypothetical protein